VVCAGWCKNCDIFMSLPPDIVGEGMFVGGSVVSFVCLFVRSDIVTAISHERLEQF